jgi:hypothetical protein
MDAESVNIYFCRIIRDISRSYWDRNSLFELYVAYQPGYAFLSDTRDFLHGR